MKIILKTLDISSIVLMAINLGLLAFDVLYWLVTGVLPGTTEGFLKDILNIFEITIPIFCSVYSIFKLIYLRLKKEPIFFFLDKGSIFLPWVYWGGFIMYLILFME